MATTRRSRRARRRASRASRRAALLAIVSSALLVVGPLMALADNTDDPGSFGGHGNGATASAHGQSQAAAHANENSNVAAEAAVEVEAQTGARGGGGAGGNGNGSARVHGDDHTSKITICHATSSVKNPYVVITVAREAAGDPAGERQSGSDHYGNHTGPIFDPSMQQGDEWGDIIPNVDDDGNLMPHDGLNWTAQGRAILQSDCEVPIQVGPGVQPPPVGQREISVRIEKTNDADEDGIFSNNEEARTEGQDVDFKLVITNTSEETVEIVTLTDSFEQTVIDLLAAECASLDGVELDPGESVTCTFTLEDYSPPQGTALVDVAEVCVEIVGGVQAACDDNPSRVRSAVVLGRTVTPTPPPAPTRTPPGGIAFTGPAAALPLAAAALLLLTLGSGLLWAGRRRGRMSG